ncbi:MAG: phosphoribosyl-ATP diphosphatase [Pseudomonadota bacterium]
MADLGASLAQLKAVIDERAAAADAQHSYVARLLHGGITKIAQKVGEEGVETALAAAAGPKEKIAEEAADLLFHLMVLLKACDVPPSEVAAVLDGRHGVSGLTEKASRSD